MWCKMWVKKGVLALLVVGALLTASAMARPCCDDCDAICNYCDDNEQFVEKIVFSGKFCAESEMDIFAVNGNCCDCECAKDLVNLTAYVDGDATRPSISPDGTKIAFNLYVPGLPEGERNRIVVLGQGCNVCVTVIEPSAILMDWADNDTLVYLKTIDECQETTFLAYVRDICDEAGATEAEVFPYRWMGQIGVLDIKVSYPEADISDMMLAASWKSCCWDDSSAIARHLYDGSFGWWFYNDQNNWYTDKDVIWNRANTTNYWMQERVYWSDQYFIVSKNSQGQVQTLWPQAGDGLKMMFGATSLQDECLLFTLKDAPDAVDGNADALVKLSLPGCEPCIILYACELERSDWGCVDKSLIDCGQKAIEVTFPNGYEELVAGECYKIAWDTADWIKIDAVDIALYTDMLCDPIIVECVNNTGCYSMKMPLVADKNVCIKIQEALCTGACEGRNYDCSDDPFEIYQCSCSNLVGDLNNDCKVNLKDLGLLSWHLFETSILPTPLAWWTFEEGMGNVAYDMSPNGYDLILRNASFDYGIIGCYALDTHLGYGIVPCDIAGGIDLSDDYTIAAWVKKDCGVSPSNPEWDQLTIVAKTYCYDGIECDCPGGWDFRVDSDPDFLGIVESCCNGFNTNNSYLCGCCEKPAELCSEVNIPCDEWVHVAVTFDRDPRWLELNLLGLDLDAQGIMTLFVDGEKVRVDVWDGYITADCDAPVTVGTNHIADCDEHLCPCGSCYHFFQGLIDDLRIYDVALDCGQICALEKMRYGVDPECGCREISPCPCRPLYSVKLPKFKLTKGQGLCPCDLGKQGCTNGCFIPEEPGEDPCPGCPQP